MKIKTEDLRAAFEVVDKVDAQVGMQASQFVRLSLTKGTFNMAMCGLVVSEANFQAEGSLATFFADRRVLGTFLGACRGVVTDLTFKENQLTLQSGKQKVVLTGMTTISGYGNWVPEKKAKTVTITAELKRELAILSQYAPISAASDHLSAVYMLKGYGVLATDMFVIAACLNADVAATIPLPVGLAKLASKMDVKQVHIEPGGGGIQLPNGYLYQALSTRLKEYPLDAIRSLVDKAAKVSTKAAFRAADLHLALTQLRQYVFGGSGDDVEAHVHCPADSTDAMFTLDLSQGKTHRKVALTTATTKEVTFKWLLNPVLPWVEYVASLDEDGVINCSMGEGNHSFQAKHKGKQYLLILADKG